MAKAEPSKNGRKLAVGIAAIAVAGVAAVVLVRGQDGRQAVAPTEAPTEQPSPPASTPLEEPRPIQNPPSAVLNRGDLLAAARAAASAYAEGTEPPTEVAALAGRRFLVRIPFGCEGPRTPNSGESAFWEIGPKGETLRISVRPEDWTASAFAQLAAGAEVEAVEGFWIPRPWQLSESCSSRGADPLLAEAPPPSPQTVGLATVFGPESSRLGRRGDRPYELTLPLSETGRPGPEGLQLVLEGRVVPFPGGRAVACRSASPDQRPVCLIGVQIERTAIRNPATSSVLGEWRDAAPLTTPAAPPASPAGSGAATRPG